MVLAISLLDAPGTESMDITSHTKYVSKTYKQAYFIFTSLLKLSISSSCYFKVAYLE